MKTRAYLAILSLFILCACLFSCAPTPTETPSNPEDGQIFDYYFPQGETLPWSSMRPPQPKSFDSVEEMCDTIKNMDLDLFLENEPDFVEYEVAYADMLCTLWKMSFFPVVEEQNTTLSCSLSPQQSGEGISVLYRFEKDGKTVVVSFIVKETVDVRKYNALYEKKGATVTAKDKEYKGIYEQTDEYTQFTFDWSSEFIMRLWVKEAVSEKEMGEVLGGLQLTVKSISDRYVYVPA